jgi:hypothetical protein
MSLVNKLILCTFLMGLASCSNDGSKPVAVDTSFRALLTTQIPEGASSNNVLPTFSVGGLDIDYFAYKVTPSLEECFVRSGFSDGLSAKVPLKIDVSGYLNGPLALCVFGVSSAGRVQSTVSYSTWTKISDPTVQVLSAVTPEGSDLVFKVNLSSVSDFDTVSRYLTIDNTIDSSLTAHGGTDFIATSGRLVIPAGATSGVVTVKTVANSRVNDVKMGLRILGTEHGTFSDSLPTGDILPIVN